MSTDSAIPPAHPEPEGSAGSATGGEDVAEVIAVPVKKFEVNITLDDLLSKISERAGSMAAAGDQEGLDPDTAQRLQRLSEVAEQLRTEMGRIEPAVMSRLAQRRTESA
jgi:hypothetical protein